MTKSKMTCSNCKKTAFADDAIDIGWIPSCWDTVPAPEGGSLDIELDGPFCPDCIVSLGLIYNDDMFDYSFPREA